MRLEPTNFENTGLGGFWNFAFVSESCGWPDAVAPFRKDKLDMVLDHFSDYLDEHDYLTLDPDDIDINIPDITPREEEYLRKGFQRIISNHRGW